MTLLASIPPQARGISLQHAQGILTRGLSIAKSMVAPPLCMVILDNGGHLKAMVSQDGVGTLRAEIAIGKANAALAMGFDSAEFYQYVQSGLLPEMFATALNGASHGKFIPLPGGVLIHATNNQHSAVIGALGISGASSKIDAQIAQQALLAAS